MGGALAASLVLCVLAAEPAPSTSVEVEAFAVGLGPKGEGLRFVRLHGPLTGGVNPDVRAKALVVQAVRELAVIHSTSWRWEHDGRIVLTYLAWAKDGALTPAAAPVPPLSAVGPTDPLRPRPPDIPELAPLAHGLRHLAFLAQQADGQVAKALGPASTEVVLRLGSAVAGELPSAH